MIDELKKVRNSKTLCEIYANEYDTDKFIVGYVAGLDDEFCLIPNFDYYGRYDGVICLATDEIYRIQTNTRYLKAIEKLIANKNCITEQNFPSIDILNSVIDCLKENKRVCQIELLDCDVVNLSGIVEAFDRQNGTIKLDCVDDYGTSDGECTIDVQAINLISYNSSDTKRIEFLMK